MLPGLNTRTNQENGQCSAPLDSSLRRSTAKGVLEEMTQ